MCFTFKKIEVQHQYIVPGRYRGIRVDLKTSFDYKVYVHLPGEEFWINGLDYFPSPISRILLESKSNRFAGVTLDMGETEMTSLNKPRDPCRDYSRDQCYDNKLNSFSYLSQHYFQTFFRFSIISFSANMVANQFTKTRHM
jgi:hypothetical protein